MHLDRTTRRILGSLVEKRYATPEQYPLTLNALVLACNQKSNRDPEMHLEEFIVEGCLRQLRVEGWVTVVEREYGRAVRYGERLVEQLALSDEEAAVMAELLLRGPQTEQELHRRCERMKPLGTLDGAVAILRGLESRSLVRHLPRETGQRVARWKHLLSPPDEEPAPAPAAASAPGDDPGPRDAAPTPGRIDHAYVETRTFDRTTTFWKELGFDVRESWGGPGHRAAIFQRGESRVVVAECAPDDAAQRATVHFDAPDIEIIAASASAARETVVVATPLGPTHWGTRWLRVRDPDGNLWAFEKR